MERLTRRGEDGKGYFKALDPDCTCNRECPRLWEHMQMLSERLAAYEDTGLTPDEIAILNDGCEECEIARRDFEFMHEFQDIDHLRSIVQAEQEGRIIVLPPPAKEVDERPECFGSCTGIWCHGYEGFGYEDHHDHCKKCWYFEDFEDEAEAALEGGEG